MEIQADAVVLGKNIRRIRKSQHRTQEDLAFEAGISVKMLSEYENGKREMSSQVLFRIADALMVPVDELVPDRLTGRSPTPGSITLVLRAAVCLFSNPCRVSDLALTMMPLM